MTVIPVTAVTFVRIKDGPFLANKVPFLGQKTLKRQKRARIFEKRSLFWKETAESRKVGSLLPEVTPLLEEKSRKSRKWGHIFGK